MKYFINGNEINFGDKFFHVKECNFAGITSTTTFEGTLTKNNVKHLIDLNVIKASNPEKKIIDDLDKNIKILEDVNKILENLLK